MKSSSTEPSSCESSEYTISLKSTVLTFESIAGTETTAGFLAGLFNLLLRDLRVLDKLTHEIRSAFPTDEDLTYEALNKLPYLTAVIDEGLRCFPSAPIGFTRTVPAGGDTVDGQFIPGGVSIPRKQLSLDKWMGLILRNVDDRFRPYVGSNPQRAQLQGTVPVPS